MARLKEKWQGELEEWSNRRLDELEAVYLWVDGLYVKAGFEKEKAAVLVVLAGLSHGRKVVLALVPGHRESTESWSGVLRDLRARGLRPPRLVIGESHLGIWAGLRNIFPRGRRATMLEPSDPQRPGQGTEAAARAGRIAAEADPLC